MTIPIDNGPMRLEDWRPIVSKRLPRLDGHARDPEDMEDWVTAGRHGGWTRAQVIAALAALIMEFTGYRVMPGHLAQKIAEQRERVRAHWYCPDPPRRLGGDPQAEIEWRRAAHRDYADRALLALASGASIEDVPMTLEPEALQLRPELPEARERFDRMIADIAAAKAVPDEPLPAERPDVDPQRMADARAELDSVRASTTADSA